MKMIRFLIRLCLQEARFIITKRQMTTWWRWRATTNWQKESLSSFGTLLRPRQIISIELLQILPRGILASSKSVDNAKKMAICRENVTKSCIAVSIALASTAPINAHNCLSTKKKARMSVLDVTAMAIEQNNATIWLTRRRLTCLPSKP